MDDIRKAAILLMSLDKPLAAEVVSQLSRRMVEMVTLEIAKIEDVTKDEQEAVLDEFQTLVRDRGPIEPGRMELAAEQLK